jgi:hypothetical protein
MAITSRRRGWGEWRRWVPIAENRRHAARGAASDAPCRAARVCERVRDSGPGARGSRLGARGESPRLHVPASPEPLVPLKQTRVRAPARTRRKAVVGANPHAQRARYDRSVNWNDFAAALRKRGWIVDVREPPVLRVPKVLRRYPRLPDEFTDMLARFRLVAHSDQARWFTMLEDYDGTSGLAFAWDEWERLELAAVPEEREAISRFWSRHCPFSTDIRGDYSFLAIDTTSGHVVDGVGPDFEAVTPIASSLLELVEGISASTLDLQLLR